MCIHDKVNKKLDQSIEILDKNMEKAESINSEIKIMRTNFLIKMARQIVEVHERKWESYEPCKGKV